MSHSPAVPDAMATNVSDISWPEIVEAQVLALKYGSVEVTVHEGRVVQVETKVRVRLEQPN